jgi:hypothetical protein
MCFVFYMHVYSSCCFFIEEYEKIIERKSSSYNFTKSTDSRGGVTHGQKTLASNVSSSYFTVGSALGATFPAFLL